MHTADWPHPEGSNAAPGPTDDFRFALMYIKRQRAGQESRSELTLFGIAVDAANAEGLL
jgi:hypothetical protein